MSEARFDARRAVLRCGRCGRFADWMDARVQVVCLCRPDLAIPPPLVREASENDRHLALDLFEREFSGRPMIADGHPVSMAELSVLVAETEAGVKGALAWRTAERGLHIVAMATDPMWQRSGVGGQLLAEAEQLGRQQSTPRVIVTLTNDNIPALYFYQRRGYRLSMVLAGAAAPHVRDPHVVGFAGIPVRDEIQLTKEL